ncbi:hypothetical protein GmHk_18G052674 [Glycine max]|nr:hypothetical protein GmHk_18G052674 [Glycine max]
MMEAMMTMNNIMKELSEDFKIQHHDLTPHHPKMNGAVEATNKNIKKIIQKMTRTFVGTSTGAILFSLEYGMEADFSFKVEIPSLRVSHVQKDLRGKLAPNYEGPFMVKKAFLDGTLTLTNMDGEELPLPVNSDDVEQYYA